MLRRKLRTPGAKPSEVKLTDDYVDIDVNCTLDVGDFRNSKELVELCVIAVTDSDKICVGSVDVDLKESFDSVEGTLKGVADQDGYIVYSYAREDREKEGKEVKEIKEGKEGKVQSSKSLEDKEKPAQLKIGERKAFNSRGFIKYKNSSSGSSYNENQQSFEKSGSESPFRKNKFPQPLDPKSDEYHRLLDELYHEILVEQLSNQKAWNRIQEN